LIVAAIDIGTNSVQLVIAQRRNNTLEPILEAGTITRIGQGVDETRRLHPEAIHRTLDCLQLYADCIQQHHADRVDAVITSAGRDAAGIEGFLEAASNILGCRPKVIVGEKEALLTCRGALSGIEVEGPFALYDVGGGSTEIVLGTTAQDGQPAMRELFSLDIGCVRMAERHIHTDPPPRAELCAVREAVDRALAPLPCPQPGLAWIGVGGTITSLVAVKMALEPYRHDVVHGAELSVAEVTDLVERLAAMPMPERRQVPGLDPKRADVIVAGGCVVESLLRWSGQVTTVVSGRGVQWGLAHEASSQG